MTGLTDPDLLARLTDWLPPNTEPTRPLMQLATVDAAGRPDLRSLLLSEWDSSGFSFHTDERSRKVADLRDNPAVAMAVVWPAVPRQLTVQGFAEPADIQSQARVYGARSAYLRQLAWQNTDAVAQLEQPARERLWAQFQADNDIATLEPPDTWIGFLVRPTRVTFWDANPLAPSRRTEFRLDRDLWTQQILAG